MLTLFKINEYTRDVPLALLVKVHKGLTATPDGHENGFHVTAVPPVPVNDPEGMPPTVTPERLVAELALPNDTELRVAVPLMSMVPLIGTAWSVWLIPTSSATAAVISDNFVFIVFYLFGFGFFYYKLLDF
jgi:hypothetical protein